MKAMLAIYRQMWHTVANKRVFFLCTFIFHAPRMDESQQSNMSKEDAHG